MRTAVFGYGSLVDPRSAEATLGRPVERVWPARLSCWRRRFSTARDNVGTEKTFARVQDGWVPSTVLALNLEPDPTGTTAPNGAVIEVDRSELERLDRRELRYDRTEVTHGVQGGDLSPGSGLRIFAYVAKSEHLAWQPPPGAVILASYLVAVESAFASLGPGEVRTYQDTTGPPPVEVIEARLVRARIRQGNPRGW